VGEGRAADPHDAALQPDVNSYWMCDIGRFDYHWVESDRRLLQPHVRRGASNDAASWADALVTVNDAVSTAGGPGSVRFLASRTHRSKSSSCSARSPPRRAA